ncbi:sigma-70 family RNA polymerase sigma factor [Gorillibacterium massiliense]|uniref:sigma-70 family RNA polymerase sigma factor n=1 Tax=Gorillibacterium massiliense TaxID=1280390 RepID=UPI0004BA0CA1|nr:sigma-70 family RNA polymerase sigma factor [Gorillibacterium massiliense]
MDSEKIKLIKRAKKGDGKAFEDLIGESKINLYKMAFLYVKNKNDALDIVSEAVFKTYSSLHTLKNDKYFNTWTMRILINCCKDFLRKKQKVVLLPEREDGSNPLDNIPDDPDLFLDERMDLYDAIDCLENAQLKSVIILKYFKGMTIKETAQVLELPEGTVKTYLHRALLFLRRKLKEDVG